MNDEEIIEIGEELIQSYAESCLDRKLTKNECEEVYEAIHDDLCFFIQDKINEVIDFNEMLERNKNADKKFPYYKTYWRNENAYQSEFKQLRLFKNEEDARKFVHHDFIIEFDEWRVVRVDKDGAETEVYKVNC